MASELSVQLPGLMSDVAQAIANKNADPARIRGELNRHSILCSVEKHQPIGATQLSEILGLTRETTRNHLSILQKRGKVKRLDGHFGGWVLP